jgi:phospholipase/carboxylesterase
VDETPELDAGAALWTAPPDARGGRPLLVLLHGYGADERDLFGLWRYFPPEFVVAAVRAPLAPPFPAPGYAWYTIDELDGRAAGGATEAATAFLAWLDAEAPDASAVGLLGFSQGAAVSLQALRLQPERFAFAVNLSGYADPVPLPGDPALAERRPPVFWGRGARDEVIPAYLVEHTAQWLPDHADLSGRVYPGLTHSVSEPEIEDLRAFLDARVAELGDPA